jgi:hypothetical protein
VCNALISYIKHWLNKIVAFIAFFNWYSGGWSPVGSSRHCGYQWPIVLALGDYNDGEIGGMIGRGNRSARIKPASVLPICEPGPPHWEACV